MMDSFWKAEISKKKNLYKFFLFLQSICTVFAIKMHYICNSSFIDSTKLVCFQKAADRVYQPY